MSDLDLIPRIPPARPEKGLARNLSQQDPPPQVLASHDYSHVSTLARLISAVKCFCI